jgi:hypothetical protein
MPTKSRNYLPNLIQTSKSTKTPPTLNKRFDLGEQKDIDRRIWHIPNEGRNQAYTDSGASTIRMALQGTSVQAPDAFRPADLKHGVEDAVVVVGGEGGGFESGLD